jgi:hypothetical protein
MWVVKKPKNPKILWPKPLAHRNMYGGTKRGDRHKTKVNVDTMMMVWLAICLYSFEWIMDSWIRKCREGLGCKSISWRAKREGLCRRKDLS